MCAPTCPLCSCSGLAARFPGNDDYTAWDCFDCCSGLQLSLDKKDEKMALQCQVLHFRYYREPWPKYSLWSTYLHKAETFNKSDVPPSVADISRYCHEGAFGSCCRLGALSASDIELKGTPKNEWFALGKAPCLFPLETTLYFYIYNINTFWHNKSCFQRGQ